TTTGSRSSGSCAREWLGAAAATSMESATRPRRVIVGGMLPARPRGVNAGVGCASWIGSGRSTGRPASTRRTSDSRRSRWPLDSPRPRRGCRVGPGDRVALYLENCPQFAIAHFGTLKAGAITVALNPMHKAHEVGHEL